MSSTVFFLIFRTNELLSNMHMHMHIYIYIYACFRIVSVYFIHLFDLISQMTIQFSSSQEHLRLDCQIQRADFKY